MLAHTTAQLEFDKKYITANQLMNDVNVSRAGLQYARRSGKIPSPAIVVNEGRLLIWEREIVQPYIDAWKAKLIAQRGE